MGHRLWRRLYQVRHPDHPWLAPGAIAFLESNLNREMKALEWGSGRSTIWLGRRVKALTSVEHYPGWHARVGRRIASAGITSVDHRLVEVPGDPQEAAAALWLNPPYVRVIEEFADGSLDLVLVDGLYRQECVARALPKVRPGGFLVIDQAAHLSSLDDWGVPEDWPIRYRHPSPLRDTVIWQRPMEA